MPGSFLRRIEVPGLIRSGDKPMARQGVLPSFNVLDQRAAVEAHRPAVAEVHKFDELHGRDGIRLA